MTKPPRSLRRGRAPGSVDELRKRHQVAISLYRLGRLKPGRKRSVIEIARELGCSRSSVHRWVNAAIINRTRAAPVRRPGPKKGETAERSAAGRIARSLLESRTRRGAGTTTELGRQIASRAKHPPPDWMEHVVGATDPATVWIRHVARRLLQEPTLSDDVVDAVCKIAQKAAHAADAQVAMRRGT